MEGNHTAGKIISILIYSVNHAWLLSSYWIQFSDANCFAFTRVCEYRKCVINELKKQVTNWTLIAKNPLGVKTLTDTADPTHRGKTYLKYFLHFAWPKHLIVNLIIGLFVFSCTVLLRAPSKISHDAYARNVTLRWSWNEESYALFPMICQVKLNGNIYNVGVIRFHLALKLISFLFYLSTVYTCKAFTCILTNVHTFSSFTKKTFNGMGLTSAVLINLQPFATYTAQVQCGSYEHFYEWGDWSEITEFSTKEDSKYSED